MKKLDITGERYGRLVAVSQSPNIGRRTVWRFLCDCGVEKDIDLDPVRSGKTRSCGCLRIEVLIHRSVTHGHSVGRKPSRELRSYNHAKSRCTNKNDPKYEQYGGRGIRMCAEWLTDASKFIDDMGKCPAGHTLDRINVHGDYEPGNCRWATSHQQARTRTDNVYAQYNGKTVVLKDYAALVGVNYKSLHAQIKYRGKTIEQATEYLLK